MRDYRHDYRTDKMDSAIIGGDGPFFDSVCGYCSE